MVVSLHCNQCAYIGTTAKDAMAHVRENQTHTVTGDGAIEGTTITVSVVRGDED